MASWTSIEQFIVNGLMPAFGNKPFYAGIFLSLSFFIALGFWKVGLESAVLLSSALVILLVGTTNLLPPVVGYVVILVMLIPLYWALRGIFSR
jgi:hypothetical protein